MEYNTSNIEYRNSIIEMRVEKQNQFNSFTKLLTRIDAANLGDHELKVLKQEHDYLDRLRHQRVKIEDLKQKYDNVESQLSEQIESNQILSQLVEQKCQIIQHLQNSLQIEITKRQNAQKALHKHSEVNQGKRRLKIKQIEQQNQHLKVTLRQKQITCITMQEQLNEKIRKLKQSFQAERKTLLMDLQGRLSQAKSKNTDNQVVELRSLVSRQNKALKMQNQRFEQISSQNESLNAQIQELREEINRKQSQNESYQSRVRQLYEQIEEMQNRLQKQDHSNKMKLQLEEIRRKMTQMQKGEIERIQFIVNELE